jgi:hypothetical protein
MTQIRVTGSPAPAGVVVKAVSKTEQVTQVAVSPKTLVGPPGIQGPVGPVGPAGETGPSGGELVSRAVADGDALPDPGSERLAWSTVTNSLVMYVQGRWRAVSPGISVGVTPPGNPILNQIWIDTN